MNYCQKRTITNCLGKILQFYQYGKEGLVLEPGGFVELFAARCPDLYEDNKNFDFQYYFGYLYQFAH